MEDKLLPCPFCGEEAEIFNVKSSKPQREAGYGDKSYGVRCTANLQCGAENSNAVNANDAIKGWNTRTPATGAVDLKVKTATELMQKDARIGSDHSWLIYAVIDHLAAQGLIGIPEGYALVPIEPTGEMIGKGIDAWYKSQFATVSIYKAMIVAAPKKGGL